MFSRLALTCGFASVLAIPAIAQSDIRRDLASLVGTWALRTSDPKFLPVPNIKSQTIAITCVGNQVEISASTDGEKSVSQLMVDGRQQTSQTIPPLLHGEVVGSRWDGTSPILTIVGGSWLTGTSTATERWTPSPDGRTLTRSWGAFKTLAIVYDRRPAR